jgi:ABC-type transport system involved in Fe-S cluster assembly fused permease/ATPase subunit
MAIGKIIESGTHQELLQLAGAYSALFKIGKLEPRSQ